MKIFHVALIAFLAISRAFSHHSEYVGFKVFKVLPTTSEQIQIFRDLEKNLEDVDVWQSPSLMGREGLVMVSPKTEAAYLKALNDGNIKYETHIEDVKSYLESENHEHSKTKRSTRAFSFEDYHSYEEIDQFLTDIATLYPNIVTVGSAGTSGNGRDIKYVRLSTSNFENPIKPIIFIDGGIYGREWLSPATVLYIIYKLVVDATAQGLLNGADWIFVPLVNPDGYEYTHTNLRLWKKSLNDNHYLGLVCPGVELNRNFDIEWMKAGSSSSPCSHDYAGPTEFSEPESQVIRDILQSYSGRITTYLSIHSSGGYLLYPWKYDGTLSPNAISLHLLGISAAAQMNNYIIPGAESYIVGNAALAVSEVASGTSTDYAHSRGVVTVFTLGLPSFGYGVLVPPQYILRVGEQTFAGIDVIARDAIYVRRDADMASILRN